MRRAVGVMGALVALALVLVVRAGNEPWTRRTVQLIGIGDSITAGFGASPGKSYFEMLVRDLKPRMPGLRAVNRSVSGSTSFDHARQVEAIPGSRDLTWVVMTTGGNDLIHAYGRMPPREDAIYGATWAQAQPWIRGFEKRLVGMLDTIGERFPAGSRIFLANIYDPTDGRGDIEHAGLPPWPDGLRILGAYNEVIARAARRPNVTLVNIHDAFMGHGIHHERSPYWYYANLEDPNDAGYAAIHGLFLDAITQHRPKE